jgi:hypothetical protein
MRNPITPPIRGAGHRAGRRAPSAASFVSRRDLLDLEYVARLLGESNAYFDVFEDSVGAVTG